MAPTANVSVDPILFSPNGDGIKDESQFSLKADDANGLYGWLLTIKDKEGAPVRNIRAKGAPPGAIRWDGRGDFEEDVPDGAYTYELSIDDLAGNRTVTPPQKVTINRAGLVSTVDVAPLLFSPNNDGINDVWNIVGLSSYTDCMVEIYNRYGQLMFQSNGYNKPWDGNYKGSSLPVGAYYYIIKSKILGTKIGSVTILK